jgi:hypothetical protein
MEWVPTVWEPKSGSLQSGSLESGLYDEKIFGGTETTFSGFMFSGGICCDKTLRVVCLWWCSVFVFLNKTNT